MDGIIPSFAHLGIVDSHFPIPIRNCSHLGIAKFDPKVFNSAQIPLFNNFQFLSQAMETFMESFKPKHQENFIFIYLS